MIAAQEDLDKDLKLLSTILYTACSFFLVDLHYDRLVTSCGNFGWTTPERQAVDTALYSAILGQAHLTLRVRLLCDRLGRLEAQASPTEVQKNILGRLASKADEHPAIFGDAQTKADKWTLFPDTDVTKADQRLVLNKTTSRSHYELPVKRLHTSYADFQEVLLYNAQGQVTEGTITSVAFWRNGRWTTPRTESGCLRGVMRRYLLDNGLVVEGDISKEEIVEGEHVLLFNALRGVLDAQLSLQRPAA